jgi:hypothetical protein
VFKHVETINTEEKTKGCTSRSHRSTRVEALVDLMASSTHYCPCEALCTETGAVPTIWRPEDKARRQRGGVILARAILVPCMTTSDHGAIHVIRL